MCSWFGSLTLFGNRVICEASGWPVLVAGLGALLVALVVAGWVVRRGSGMLEKVGALLVILSAVFLSLSAGLPVLQPLGDRPSGGRVVVLIDASESVRRTGSQDLQVARAGVAVQLQQMAADLPYEADWRGAIWAFGGSPRVIAPDATLGDLAASVTGADLGALAANSNLEAATEAALRDIAGGPGAGMVVLITDGLETQGDVMNAVARAQQVGVPFHVMAVGSDRPAEGLLSYDIGPDQAIGRPAVLRATVLGEGVVRWEINGVPEPDQLIADAGRPRALRIPVQFGERGLNFVGLGFAVEGQAERAELAYTLVRGPARVLVYGAAPWVDAADPGAFLINRADPGDPVELGSYDAIVIDTKEPADFAPDMPERLVETAAGGVGLFIVNGPLRGSREDMQRLSDWEETALGPVLPVNSDPAEYVAEPPKRDVMIIIDTSGSMTGTPLTVAQAVANSIVDSVRPQDSLLIIPFSADVGRIFETTKATSSEVSRARQYIRSLRADGSTVPSSALKRARQLQGNNCSLFVIGDGYGYPPGLIYSRPICYTTSIGVTDVILPGIDTSFGQPIKIRSARQLGQVTFEVFKPEPRSTFWQDGPLRAIPADNVSTFGMQVPISGVALSYLRPESTDISIMTDPPRAPVLAFRHDPVQRSLRTGIFLGVVPNGLPGGPDGWASAVLQQLVGWDDPDLFDIDFRLDGENIELRITPLGAGLGPSKIGASILLPDGGSEGISLGPPNQYGVFVGKGRVSLSNTTMRGILNLEMGGGESQSIPLRLPARLQSGLGGSGSQEAFGFGLDSVLLNEIQSQTGGINLALDRPTVGRDAIVLRKIPIWPWLSGFAVFFFAGSLFCGGVRR